MIKEILIWSISKKEEMPEAAMFLTDRDKMSNLYREPVIDTSYQVSIHLANQLQRRFVKIGLFFYLVFYVFYYLCKAT
jgi:hypothetical protein